MILKYIANTNIQLKEFLFANNISNKRLKLIKREGYILVNNIPVNVLEMLKPNDIVEVMFPEKQNEIIPINKPIEILYEDEYILIINKEPLVSCMPNKRFYLDSLANYITYYYQQNNIDATIHIITRLDVTTSGIVVVAKNGYYRYLLEELNIDKYYIAITSNKLIGEGMISLPLMQKENKRVVDSKGKKAKTYYESLYCNNDYSIVKLKLFSGRTHQIRVHLQNINHPIISDHLYGIENKFINRVALHCYQISFIHPITNKKLIINAKIPNDMKQFIINKIINKN